MGQWDSEPDPYTYELVPEHDQSRAIARRRYLVSRDGRALGVIERCRINTDRHPKGVRWRIPGKGRVGWQTASYFALGCGSGRWASAGAQRDRRRDAAADLEREPMPDQEIERARGYINGAA